MRASNISKWDFTQMNPLDLNGVGTGKMICSQCRTFSIDTFVFNNMQ
jgi:hypothetical protein